MRAPNDRLLHLGMNRSCGHEAAELRRAGLPVEVAPGRARGAEGVAYRGRTYPLNTETEQAAFVEALGLPAEVAARVRLVLKETEWTEERVTLAGLAAAWAPAERGGSVPSRLILSGHSAGDLIWGDREMELGRKDLERLARAMPKAAAQIEDLLLHGCNTAGSERVSQWGAAFPNLRTVWAYSSDAPGSYTGAVPHMLEWARATRGRAETLDPAAAGEHRKGGNVSTWSSQDGYRPGRKEAQSHASLAELGSWSGPMEAYLSGAREVSDPHQGELRTHYTLLQNALGSGGLDPSVESFVANKAAQAVRLLYYREKIAPAFAAEHAQAIKAGYEALGLEPPRFEQLSRQEAMRAIERFALAAESHGHARLPEAVYRLLPLLTQGLRDLDRRLIPDRWI